MKNLLWAILPALGLAWSGHFSAALAVTFSFPSENWGCPGSVESSPGERTLLSAGCSGAGVVASSGTKEIRGGYFSMPIIPPAAITHSTASTPAVLQAIDLVWKTTGDEGYLHAHGNGTEFRIGYSTYSLSPTTDTPGVNYITISTWSIPPGNIIGLGSEFTHRLGTATALTLGNWNGIDTRYYIRIWTKNGFGLWSERSVERRRFTLARPPMNSFVDSASTRSAILSWNSNANPDYTYYQVWRDVSADFDAHPEFFDTTGASAEITDLFPGTTYYFQVRARNGDGVYTVFDSTVPSACTLGDPSIGHWIVPKGYMNVARSSHAAVTLLDGRVLVAGGIGPGVTISSTTEVYDVSAGTWSFTVNMSSPRYGHTLTVLPGGDVLAAGGHNGSAYLDSAEIFSAGAWTDAGTFSTARMYHRATLRSGTMLVTGGEIGVGVYTDSTRLFSPGPVWSSTAPMNTPRSRHEAVLLGGDRILVMGGETSGGVIISSAEYSNPAISAWENTLNDMNSRRKDHRAVMLQTGPHTGKVLVTGGFTVSGATSTTEIYNPGTNDWLPAGEMNPMNFPRYGHTMTLLSDGRVFVAGGHNGVEYSSTTEIHTPQDGTWNRSDDLATPRARHTASLLPDGRVVIAGGETPSGDVTASVEIFNATTTLVGEGSELLMTGPDGKTTVAISPGALPPNSAIFISTRPTAVPLAVNPAVIESALQSASTGILLIPGSMREFIAYVNGKVYESSFAARVTISIPYEDDDGDGIVDNLTETVFAKDLDLYYLDTGNEAWEPVPGSTLDQANHKVFADVSHFSVYALFGIPTILGTFDTAAVYPVPWKIGSGGIFDRDKLMFADLPEEATIRIYNLAGELVLKHSHSLVIVGEPEWEWDGTNTYGKRVGSGIYFAIIESPSFPERKIMKLAIER